jgi:glycosyltransferase involved in cell wall biosynthesis
MLPQAVARSQTEPLPGCSLVVPAYNEEQGIKAVLEQLCSLAQNTDLPYEILVVDDGSQDKTAAVVASFTGVTLLRHAHNRGYGAALKTAIRQAQYEIICITDADGTYPNECIPELVAHLQAGTAMVVGARTGLAVYIPPLRRPAKWLINRLANLVVGEAVPDVNSGLRVFRRSVALRFFKLLPDGFSFTTTITLAMLTNGYQVDYLAIDYHPRLGQSKIRPIRDTLNFIQLILRIGLYFAPLKIFLPLSALCLLAALVWGLFSSLVLGRLADVSTLIIAMTGFQVAMVGLLAELINHRLPSYRDDE